MKTLLKQTKTDLKAGQTSWRVLMTFSITSLFATFAYFAILNF